jgi:hypothetical protein
LQPAVQQQQPIQVPFIGKMEMPAAEDEGGQQQPPGTTDRYGHGQRGIPFLIPKIPVCQKKFKQKVNKY